MPAAAPSRGPVPRAVVTQARQPPIVAASGPRVHQTGCIRAIVPDRRSIRIYAIREIARATLHQNGHPWP